MPVKWIFVVIATIMLLVCNTKSMDVEEIHQLRDTVKEMFYHGYDNYMRHAFPRDELKPISCGGMETWGGYSLTLIDALDSLIVMNNKTEFAKAVHWIVDSINFNRDVNVSVFETNIRVVGGLLSAHILASDSSLNVMPDYKGELLPMVRDLVDRLMPAFDTPTGIPYGTVNLKYGVPPEEVKITCTAGGGTFLLEFGLLSILTGDTKYLDAARKSNEALFQRRSPIGLVGNHIEIFSGEWTHRDSGVGSGIDSYFEYLFKGYMLFNDHSSLALFNQLYDSIMQHVYKRPWYVDVEMHSGKVTWPLLNSLQCFWPGLQVLTGHVEQAKETLLAFHSVWRRYGVLPEGFNIVGGHVQPGQKGYPLRPELAESNYYLYRATRDPMFLNIARDITLSLNTITRAQCGFASVGDVENHNHLTDRMESFFLSETLKYLYLTFDLDNFVNEGPVMKYTFNTEGHLIPLRPEFLFHDGQIQSSLQKINSSSQLFSNVIGEITPITEPSMMSIGDAQAKCSTAAHEDMFSAYNLGVCDLGLIAHTSAIPSLVASN